MSDGDHAAPGRRGIPDPEGDNPWLTRTPRPSMGAAPWERGPISRPRRSDEDPWQREAAGDEFADDVSPADEPARTNHPDSGGVTVADLIAKVADEPPARRAKSHAKPEPPAPRWVDPDPEPIDDAADDPLWEAVTDPHLNRPVSDLPDLSARARRPVWPDDATTQLPAADRVPPRKFGTADVGAQAEPRPNRHRVMVAGRAAAAVTAVLALILTGGAWQWSNAKNHRLNHVAALDPNSRDIVDPNAQFGDENFLIVGVDSRAGANAEVGAGDPEDAGGARSDTVMLVNIPANRERVVAVSFPRDLEIEPMLCDAWNPDTGQYGPLYDDETGTYGPEQIYTETKLNSAYSFGGPKCLVKVIQKLSGLSVNRFMAIDFIGFEKMVDALGGVEVCSTTPLEDYELGTILPAAGRQMVDGKTALNYVRARQVTTEINGDYGRIKRQQLFLSSLMRSMISKEVFFNLNKLDNVVNMFINDSYVDNIDTKELVRLAQSLQNIAAGRISFVTVPTTGYMDEWGNEQMREEDTRALFDAIINDEPLPGENNANETTTPTTEAVTPQADTSTSATSPQPAPPTGSELVDAVTTEPHDVTVHVSNSTGQTGLGATAAGELQQHGFNVLSPDDYPSTLQATTVFYSPGNEQAAATVAKTFANPQIEQVAGMGDVVQVVLGPDFYTVNPPLPSGSPVQVQVTKGTSSTPTELPKDLSITNGADTTCE